jgi:5-(carboxyamino)imidazole ribonucleotide mutase
MDSLLSIVQMPGGIPVATVGIGNAKNGALLAVRMLAITDSTLAGKLDSYAADLAEMVATKNTALKDSLS